MTSHHDRLGFYSLNSGFYSILQFDRLGIINDIKDVKYLSKLRTLEGRNISLIKLLK